MLLLFSLDSSTYPASFCAGTIGLFIKLLFRASKMERFAKAKVVLHHLMVRSLRLPCKQSGRRSVILEVIVLHMITYLWCILTQSTQAGQKKPSSVLLVNRHTQTSSPRWLQSLNIWYIRTYTHTSSGTKNALYFSCSLSYLFFYLKYALKFPLFVLNSFAEIKLLCSSFWHGKVHVGLRCWISLI